NRVGAFQFEVVALEPLQLLTLGGRQAGALAGVALRLAHPPPERFHGATEFLRDGSHRGPLGRMLVGVITHHPDGAFTAAPGSTCWVEASGPSSLGMGPPINSVRFSTCWNTHASRFLTQSPSCTGRRQSSDSSPRSASAT